MKTQTSTGYDLHPLHVRNLHAKRERLAARKLNPDAPRVSVPFPEWLRFVKNVDDWRKLRPYRRWDFFCEYQLDCLSHGMEYDNPVVYNLYGTLI